MDVKDIVKSNIMVGDELQINEWSHRFIVAAVSPGFILAYRGEEYTIVKREPTDFGPYNGIPEGAIVCGADFWTFGWTPENTESCDWDLRWYHFDNPAWCAAYLADLESGRTEVSIRRREMIHSIDVYRHGKLVMETE